MLGELFACSGDGVVAAIVMGDPGSGKTRLLAEAVDRFAPDDTARIVGYEPEQSVPLAACAELLQTLSAAPAGRGLRLLFEQGTSARGGARVESRPTQATRAITTRPGTPQQSLRRGRMTHPLRTLSRAAAGEEASGDRR